MRQVDFSPLYRSTVGFDSLFNMFDSLTQPEVSQTYPPYNIERINDHSYRISMAVAGFDDKELDICAYRNQLIIKGEKQENTEDQTAEFLYRGIASRSFERRFHLAEHVEVVGAELRNGLLHIELLRNIPDEMKPRKIEVRSTDNSANTNKKVTTGKNVETAAA